MAARAVFQLFLHFSSPPFSSCFVTTVLNLSREITHYKRLFGKSDFGVSVHGHRLVGLNLLLLLCGKYYCRQIHDIFRKTFVSEKLLQIWGQSVGKFGHCALIGCVAAGAVAVAIAILLMVAFRGLTFFHFPSSLFFLTVFLQLQLFSFASFGGFSMKTLALQAILQFVFGVLCVTLELPEFVEPRRTNNKK